VNYSTSVTSDGTLAVSFNNVHVGWEQWVLITSDRHWDSVHSDRRLQAKHLEEAVERDALVIDLGDLFDAMQGRDDRRGSKSSVRPEHQTSQYFTSLIETAADWFEPYADRILMLGSGNHETSILKHHEINLTRHLQRELNHRTGSDIHMGRYSGWLKLSFRRSENTRDFPTQFAYYHHGSGGNSPVTKGVIQTNRRATYLPDANVVMSGHIHNTWLVPLDRERINQAGSVYQDTQWHVSVPPYKQESRREGWAAEKGFAPSMTGAVWWRLFAPEKGRIEHEFILTRH